MQKISTPSLGSSDRFFYHEAVLLNFKTFAEKGTIAWKLGAGHTNSDLPQYSYFLGGLDRVRGYESGRFNGRVYAHSNAEVRWPVVIDPNSVVQMVAFSDVMRVGDNTTKWRPFVAASAGTGVRLTQSVFQN